MMKSLLFYIRFPLVIMLTITGLLDSKSAIAKDTLTTSYYFQYLPPQYFIDEDMKVVGGVIFDITQELAHRAGLKANFIQIPRKRISSALQNQNIDLYCSANPAWYPNENLLWSLPLYRFPDVLINRKGLTQLDALANEKATNIGTTLGYVYPDLLMFLNNNNIKRVDQISPLTNWNAFQKGKIDGFVMSKLDAQHLGALEGNDIVEFNYTDIHCAFSPKMPISLYNQLTDILEEMRIAGKINAIIEYNQTIRKGWENPTRFIKP